MEGLFNDDQLMPNSTADFQKRKPWFLKKVFVLQLKNRENLNYKIFNLETQKHLMHPINARFHAECPGQCIFLWLFLVEWSSSITPQIHGTWIDQFTGTYCNCLTKASMSGRICLGISSKTYFHQFRSVTKTLQPIMGILLMIKLLEYFQFFSTRNIVVSIVLFL